MDVLTANLHLNFVETNAPALRGLASKVVFREFNEQYSNFLQAVSYFLENGHINEAFRFLSALVQFWMGTKRIEEGLALLEKSLARNGGDEALRGRVFFDVGYLYFWKGDYERARVMHSNSLALGRKSRNATVIALALTGLARVALDSDLAEARRYCLEALDVTNGTTDQLGRSNAMHVLAVVAQMTGDFAEARKLMTQRIALGRKMGNYAVVSSEMGNLSMVERQLGNLDEAEALALQAFEVDYIRGDDLAIAWKINALISVAVDRGHHERAAVLLGIADNLMKIAGGYWPPDEMVHYEHSVRVLTHEMGPDHFEQVRSQGNTMSVAEAMDFVVGSSRISLSV